MQTIRKYVVVVGLISSMAQTARANPEIPGQYDARALAMGGTGTAFLAGATGGVYINPALLDGVEGLDLALSMGPFLPRLSAPRAQPGTTAPTETAETEPVVVPLFLAAAALRVHERVAIGLGAYVSMGGGGKYENIAVFDAPGTPEEAKDDFNDERVQVANIELSIPVSVRLTDDLSVGAAWRIGYAMQETLMLVPNPMVQGMVSRSEQNLDGTSLLGAMLGLRYRVNELLTLGLSYRTKMTVDLEGETNIETNVASPGAPTAVAVDAPTTSTSSTPHQLRAGAALSLFDERLLLALEGRLQLYEETNKTIESTIDLQGQPLMQIAGTQLASSSTTAWNNAYTVQLGAEYWVLPMLALRLGWAAGNSATPRQYPSPFFPAPGLLYTASAGVGFKGERWEAGIGGMLSLNPSRAISANDIATRQDGSPAAVPGRYGASIALLALSVRYRI